MTDAIVTVPFGPTSETSATVKLLPRIDLLNLTEVEENGAVCAAASVEEMIAGPVESIANEPTYLSPASPSTPLWFWSISEPATFSTSGPMLSV